jgi:hypothetical protein
MARPDLETAQFPKGLHKKKTAPDPSPAKITGKDITAGDKVKVVSHKGKKPTVWTGTVKTVAVGGVATVEDLTVKDEEITREGEKDRGLEDVSVTVTNGPDESQPIITKDVKVVVP